MANLSPTNLRSPSRRSCKANSIEKVQTAQPTMAAPSARPNPRSTRQAPPTMANLPRFHPANFANYVHSHSSSNVPTNVITSQSHSNTPSTQLSPRSGRQTSQLSEAQQQLYLYHRELFSLNRSGSGASSPSLTGFSTSRPASPNLRPMASPGAVTPLELEEAEQQSEGYLMAGPTHQHLQRALLNDVSGKEIVDTYILRETQGTQQMDQCRPITR